MTRTPRFGRLLQGILLAAAGFLPGAGMAAPAIGSLKLIDPPPVPGLENYVRDPNMAIVLGKALFWDMQAGSDGIACASCHFHAGADNRVKNQLNPGANAGDRRFSRTRIGGGGANYTLTPGDFPFYQLVNPADRNSAVLFDTNDVVSSQGVFHRDYFWIGNPRHGVDLCASLRDRVFQINGINLRRVEPRNSPTVINAVFNFRNFWDGRAHNVFNGVDPFGPANPDAYVLAMDEDGRLTQEQVRLANSSLASQAVGPPLSEFEMSCGGRGFPDLGRKLLRLQPLAKQVVDATDSVLGPYVHPSGKGLRLSYGELIQAAFNRRYWGAQEGYDGYRQMEFNFALFWGLAIQMYESTLISDDSPFDRFVEGDANALTDQQKHGLAIFLQTGGPGHEEEEDDDGGNAIAEFLAANRLTARGRGRCINCHIGPEFTRATFNNLQHKIGGATTFELIEQMVMGDGGVAAYDSGFYNIGVTPTVEDIGLGGTNPFGLPLSFTRLSQLGYSVCDVPFDCTVSPLERVAVDGAFKTPTLRNVELTGPYMHDGSMATLEQVVEFYNRGGNRRGPDRGPDTTGFGENGSNVAPDIVPLKLSAREQAALVDFMKALTDERVRWEMAPFDHPQLFIPHGHPGDQWSVTDDGTGDGKATDDYIELPAVGAAGRAAKGLPPLKAFLE